MDFSPGRTLVIWNIAASRPERYSFQNVLDSICRRKFEEGDGGGSADCLKAQSALYFYFVLYLCYYCILQAEAVKLVLN